MFKRLKSTSGMSLIEIMIVLVIMGAIVSLVGPNVMSRLEKSKVDTTKLEMEGIKSALQDYYLDNNTYPTTAQGLEALVQKPTVAPEPLNYSPDGYLKNKNLPKDKWGAEFIYESDGSRYTIISLGKDRKEGGEGYATDIIVESE